MKLSFKLPLAFALALALVLATGLFGIFRLNRVVASFEGNVLQQVAGYKRGAEISAHFSGAIQEWKKVLLRGKDPQEQEKYWKAHSDEMLLLIKLVHELDQTVDQHASVKEHVDQLALDLKNAQQAYAAYKAAGNDFVAGDQAAKGQDRAAVKSLEELRAECPWRRNKPPTKPWPPPGSRPARPSS
jgi:methyl-accepting chemotaxis protein-1 (serine sensor receptor)